MAYVMYANDARSLRRAWVPLLLWGLGLVAFGIAIIGWPEVLGRALVWLLGGFAVLSGAVWVWWALSLRRASEGIWAVTVIPGVVLIAFGVFTLLNPSAIGQFFLWVAGGAAVLWGLVDMFSSWRLRRFFPGWWLRLLRGLLVTGLGALILVQPASGLQAVAWIIGALPLAAGVLTIWMAIWVRRLPAEGAVVVSDVEDAPPPPPPMSGTEAPAIEGEVPEGENGGEDPGQG
jgi:uncharacterized membrane protein HdeD (DUF308 family)